MAGERSSSVLLYVAGQRDPVTLSGSCFRSGPSLLRCGIDVTAVEGGLQGFLSSALQSDQNPRSRYRQRVLLCDREFLSVSLWDDTRVEALNSKGVSFRLCEHAQA